MKAEFHYPPQLFINKKCVGYLSRVDSDFEKNGFAFQLTNGRVVHIGAEFTIYQTHQPGTSDIIRIDIYTNKVKGVNLSTAGLPVIPPQPGHYTNNHISNHGGEVSVDINVDVKGFNSIGKLLKDAIPPEVVEKGDVVTAVKLWGDATNAYGKFLAGEKYYNFAIYKGTIKVGDDVDRKYLTWYTDALRDIIFSNDFKSSPSELVNSLPGVYSVVKHPEDLINSCDSKESIYLKYMIIHLNDHHRWTREKIADWIETLDIDTSFPTVPIDKPGEVEVQWNCQDG